MATFDLRRSETFVVWALSLDFASGRRRDFQRLGDALEWVYGLFDVDPERPWCLVPREYSEAEVWLDGRRLVWSSRSVGWARDIAPDIPLAIGAYQVEFDEVADCSRFALAR